MDASSSSETYTQNNNYFYKNSIELKLHPNRAINVWQLEYFKHLPNETKFLIFNILRELPIDVHLPILTILDQYEEWDIIDALNNYDKYESSEFSDPEEEYDRRLLKKFQYLWYNDSSGNETD